MCLCSLISSSQTLKEYRGIVCYYKWYFKQRGISSSIYQSHPGMSHCESTVFAIKSVSNPNILEYGLCIQMFVESSHFLLLVPVTVFLPGFPSLLFCVSRPNRTTSGLITHHHLHTLGQCSHIFLWKTTDCVCCEGFNFKTEINISFSVAM